LPDTDTDGVPDGYEAWYATRAPVIYLSEAMGTTTPDPTNPDSDTDQENSAAPSTLATRSGSGGAHTVTADTTMVLQQALGVPTSGPFKVRQVRLDLTSPLANSVATVELWYQSGLNCENAVSPAVRLAGAEVTSYLNGQGFTSFNFNTPVPVSLVGGGCLYLALRGSGSSITWRGGQATTNTWTRDYVVSSVWTQVSPTPLFSGNYEIYGEAVSSSGDGATLIQEYVAGTSPKAWNTDEWVGGRQTGVSDKLRDGDEITNGVIWRTDAQFGALEVGGYGPGTSIYYDTDPANTPISDWLFLTYEATVVDPLEPFGGSQNRTVTLFRLFDGGTIAYNVTTQKVYIIHPGSDFASPLRRTANLTVEQYYKGKAIVYTVTGGGDAAWKWNDVIRPYVTGQDPLPTPLYDQHKQLFATSPFDWDTDDDGIGDGQEQRRLFDDEEDPGFATKDSLNNGRDPDSDNDGLTDGQEMLQICSSWNELYSPGDANPPPSCSTPTLNVNPDGDTGYAMADRDSDGDGINDSKEVLWSSDSDAVPDGRINLVDPDSDGDLLCDGWCTVTMIAGMPVTANNGEDKNQNGANEQGEPSPVKYDTDGDGLWDGADVGANPGELMVLPSEGTPTTRPLGGDALAQSISSNQTNPDTDGDGVSDGAEVATYTAFYFAGTGQGTPSTRPNIKMDPTKNDTEGDGILDGVEFRRTDGSRLDTDGDAINDGLEDANKDGVRQTTEVDPLRADTDQDGLTDSKELGAAPYVHDSNEPDPLKADTDGDGVSDGNECFITDAGCTGSGLTRDSDNPTDGIPDILEKDSDGDGLDDGAENANKDGTIDANTELNPTLADTDSDGLWDGAEPVPFTDTSDADANINGRDIDSNANGANDQTDTFVILRTNALAGAYGTTGAWVAVDTTVNLLGADGNPDLSDANARYDWSATLTQLPTGTGTVFIYFGSGATDGPMALKTAQGYAVYFNAGTPNKVYIVKDETTTWEFSKASGTGGGYESSNKAQKAFVAEHQESYEWRKALNSDSDFDGLENSVETGAGSNPNVADSDGDFILDGSEPGWNLDTDLDGKKNALDKDSDNDGVADGVEDANHDGYRQAGETDMLVRDTDADGIQDGTEKGITFATDTADTCEQSGDPGCGSAWLFKQDTDTATLTNALDQDSDDDGVCDGTCAGFSEDADADGLKDAGETGATTADSDGDGIQDGTEKGLVTPLKDTDVTKFAPDKDPASVTDPTDADGDNAGGGDGVGDGLEDKNHNGRVDLGETSPILMDTDGDGLCDGLCLGQGEDKNGNGVQDKKADGTLLETDPLSKDSDVDGLLDNAEILGTWCYAGGSCTGNGALDPMNPDSDGDGLRDGQEAAGWRVGVWYERTMEKKTDYQVTSDPRATFTDTDGDTLSDFSEFLNGSDARVQDTDGDGIRDDVEIQLKSNITGIEGSPPQVVNLRLEISISWDWDHWNTVPVKTNITVRFNVSDNVGIDRVQVRLAGVLGNFTHVVQIPEGSRVEDVSETFTYSLAQAFLAGADLNITTYDVNGNGAWGEFHVDSVAETVFKTIVAVFAPIAKVVVEAVSSAFDWIWEAIQGLISAVVEPILDSARNLAIALLAPWATWLAANEFRTDPPPVQTADDPLYPFLAATILLTSALFLGYMALMLVLLAIEIMTKVVLPFLILATTAIANFVSNYLMVIVGITAIIVTFNFINPDNSEPAGGINGFLFSKMSSSEFSAFRWAGRTFLTIVAELFAGAKLISALTSPGVLALVGLTLLIISPLVAKGILKLVLDVFGYCVTMASVAHLATTPAAEAARRASIARAVGDFIAAIGAPISEYLILSRDYNGPSSIVIPPPPP
jgi:hypothetical protein